MSKLKEMVKSWSSQTILTRGDKVWRNGQTKDEGLGFLEWGWGGNVCCGKVTWKYMVRKGCLVRFVMPSQVLSGDKNCLWNSSLSSLGEKDIFTNGNLCPAFKQKEEGQRAPSEYTVS